MMKICRMQIRENRIMCILLHQQQDTYEKFAD